MSTRWLIAAVIVLVVIVGGIFLLIGSLQGDKTDQERQPVNGSAPALTSAVIGHPA